MANPYESQSATNYNASPPPDDGSQTDANKVTWTGIKTKLVDPVKALADAINTAVWSAFGSIFLNSTNAQSATYDLQASDQGALLKLSNTITLNLLAAATAGDGFAFTAKNTGTGTVTIDGSGSETIDGATTYALGPSESVTLVCDGSNWQIASAAFTETVNAQTGTTYTVVVGDRRKLVSFTNAAAIAVTLPQATGAFAAGFWFDATCLSSSTGAATITPTTSTIDGSATFVLQPGASARIVSDGTNWKVFRGLSPASQATMETATSVSTSVTPANMKWHPALPKAHILVTSLSTSPPTVNEVYNGGLGTISCVRNGTGDYTVSWVNTLTTPMPSITIESDNLNARIASVKNGGRATTSVRVVVLSDSGVATDPASLFIFMFGDLP